jgi:hypothetical protein
VATVTYIPARRVVLTALSRVFGSRYLVIALSLGIGGGLFIWARTELASMFQRNETGELVFGVVEADPACGPPSLYLMPDGDAPGTYLAVIDMLGGGIGDPSIMNIGRPAVALSSGGTPGADLRDGVRANPVNCRHMVVRLAGATVAPLIESDAGKLNVVPSPSAKIEADGDGTRISFDVPEGDEAAARTAFRLDGIDDTWQFGYRRVNLWNSGRVPVTVFLLDAPGYAFLSDTFEPIKVPLRSRSVVVAELGRPGLAGDNAYQAYSRLIDYDARLQSRLLTVSTVFGIGISLMVEGLILALLKIARLIGPAQKADEPDDDPREE